MAAWKSGPEYPRARAYGPPSGCCRRIRPTAPGLSVAKSTSSRPLRPGTDSFDPLNTIHGTLHYGYSWPWNQYSGQEFIPADNIWEQDHTYAVEWEEGEIRWYVDDIHFATNSGNWFSYYWGGQEYGYQVSSGAQPFDQPFHIILNLAIGSPWLGYPDETTSFPQTLEVDYVRVYQCSTDPDTGKGCATAGNPSHTPASITGHVPPADTREEVVLYQNGVQTLNLEGDAGPVASGLTPGFWEASGGNVVSDPAYHDGENTVWDIQFLGSGNAFLTSDDGLNFGDNTNSYAKNLGEIRFDLKVLSIDPGTELRIKIDSGWPNLSYHEIDTPPVGDWEEVAVRLYSMSPNDAEAWLPTVDYSNVLNPFVIEPSGGAAHLQLNNIRFVCQGGTDDCGIKPIEPPLAISSDFDIFIDAVDDLWGSIGQWSASNTHVQVSTVDAGARGQVFQGSFLEAGGSGLMFIQTEPGIVRDVTALADGFLVFDVFLPAYDPATTGLIVKADCVHPCSSGNYPIGLVGTTDWETVVVPIADLVAGGLDLSSVNTPFVILPEGEQGGVVIQVDNIRWTLTDPR